jgi:hypothetical protein
VRARQRGQGERERDWIVSGRYLSVAGNDQRTNREGQEGAEWGKDEKVLSQALTSFCPALAERRHQLKKHTASSRQQYRRGNSPKYRR